MPNICAFRFLEYLDAPHSFTLLETVYRAFDKMAKQRQVFKVETVGDCYGMFENWQCVKSTCLSCTHLGFPFLYFFTVAVAGCPDPMKNHAVVIARFALECMTTMDTLTKRLEVTLGPDTGDLAVRIGLHSGPVTGKHMFVRPALSRL